MNDMDAQDTVRNTAVRYEPEEKPPALLSLGLGLQLAVLFGFVCVIERQQY